MSKGTLSTKDLPYTRTLITTQTLRYSQAIGNLIHGKYQGPSQLESAASSAQINQLFECTIHAIAQRSPSN